jgi:hypothetical protein
MGRPTSDKINFRVRVLQETEQVHFALVDRG